jgi:hypothetical protein
MKSAILVALLFIFPGLASAQTSVRLKDVVGSYVGCGDYSALGNRKVAFHLVSMTESLDGKQNLTASIGWADSLGKFNSLLAVYFPDVQMDLAQGKFFMKLSIVPKRDYGTIFKTLLVEIQKDGSVKGKFQANSMQANGSILHGEFVAHRLAPGTSPEQFECH